MILFLAQKRRHNETECRDGSPLLSSLVHSAFDSMLMKLPYRFSTLLQWPKSAQPYWYEYGNPGSSILPLQDDLQEAHL
jgi:hypothetical protein